MSRATEESLFRATIRRSQAARAWASSEEVEAAVGEADAQAARLPGLRGLQRRRARGDLRFRGAKLLAEQSGGEFVVVYDPSIVARTAVQKTSLTQGFDLRFEDDGAGQLRFALADDTPISGDGELATIRLTLVTTDTRGASAPLLLADARLNDRNGRDFVTGFPDNSIVRQSGQVSLSLIQLSPTGLTFSAKQGESNPPAQSLTVDLGGAAENWTASSDQAWLSVSPTSGNGDGSVEVSVDMATLPAGIHNGQVTIAVGEETSTSTVVFTVEDPAAALDVSPASLSFNATLGDANPAAQSLTVDLAGAAVAWTAAADQNWIGVSPASGNGNGSVSVSVDATGLSAGTHNGQVTITAGDQTRTSAVTLTIDDPNATLQVSPGSLSFSATAGGNNPGSQTLTIDPGDAGTGWSATASQPWLSIAPASGTGPGSASVSVNIDGLSTGSHNAQIQVTAGDQTVNRSVTLTVLDPGQETKVFLPAVIR